MTCRRGATAAVWCVALAVVPVVPVVPISPVSLASPDARAGQAAAQSAASARTWVGRASEMEAHLRTATVERIEDIGTGVTHPRRAHLKEITPFDSFAWKVLPPGRRGGYWESYKSEIAAYELDKLLDMNVIPPAVERTIDGETGAAVMWLASPRSVKQSGGQVPSAPVWGRSIRTMKMFDDLIANIDRNAGNILIGAPGELILIDHSRAFGTDKKLVNPLERVDAAVWARMRALDHQQLTQTLGRWIDGDQIQALLDRRDAMIKAVDKLVARKGRAAVIIP